MANAEVACKRFRERELLISICVTVVATIVSFGVLANSIKVLVILFGAFVKAKVKCLHAHSRSTCNRFVFRGEG